MQTSETQECRLAFVVAFMLGGKIDRLPGVSYFRPLESVSKLQRTYSLGEIKAIERNRNGCHPLSNTFKHTPNQHRIGKIKSLESNFFTGVRFQGCELGRFDVHWWIGVCTLHERQGMVEWQGLPFSVTYS